MKTNRMSQTGAEQIRKGTKFIIVAAAAYFEDIAITGNEAYHGLSVALAFDEYQGRYPVSSKVGHWYFDETDKGHQAIRRLNKDAEIIFMTADQYKLFAAEDRYNDIKLFDETKMKVEKLNTLVR